MGAAAGVAGSAGSWRRRRRGGPAAAPAGQRAKGGRSNGRGRRCSSWRRSGRRQAGAAACG